VTIEPSSRPLIPIHGEIVALDGYTYPAATAIAVYTVRNSEIAMPTGLMSLLVLFGRLTPHFVEFREPEPEYEITVRTDQIPAEDLADADWLVIGFSSDDGFPSQYVMVALDK